MDEQIPELFDDIVDFVEQAISEKKADQSSVQDLQVALKKAKEDHERIILEKVAATKANIFDKSIMEETFRKLASLSILDATAVGHLAHKIQEDPNFVFPIMTKIAEILLTVPGEGSGIDKVSGSSYGDEDPDGWIAFAHGKSVKVIR